MIKRRNFIKASALLTVPAIFGGSGVANAQLCRPTGNRAVTTEPDSATFFPNVQPYTQALFIPPAMVDIPESELATSGTIPQEINPNKHQRYNEFPAEQIHQQFVEEGHWNYHDEITRGTQGQVPDGNGGFTGKGSVAWMYSGGPDDGVGVEGEFGSILSTPGPTMVAHYGKPVFIRRLNRLPDAADVMMPVGYPAVSTHLHNAHTASESDGYPMDFMQVGDHWDHHYAMYLARNDPKEALASLWYHDHMIDFTATNVYAGLSGLAIFYDDIDTGNENDTAAGALRLPGNLEFGGDDEGNANGYDISLLLHDVRFSADGNPTYNVFDTDGHLGDFLTVNRKVMPFMNVKPRKYRFRVYDGGPSRFYELALYNTADRDTQIG
ncbi:Multicopper oxidase, partial [hydrothermal vent metagenome]